jgi:hypothetical protein
MKPLVLTTDNSSAGHIDAAGLANFTITLERRLVWGPPLSQVHLDAYFAPRTTRAGDLYWQYHTPAWRIARSRGKGLGLVEFCTRYDEAELWIDPDPNAQLNLIWLLDFLRDHGQLALKMKFFQADFRLGNFLPEKLDGWRPPAVEVTSNHLETAGLAWQAYRAPTPQAWFNLLDKDLSALPQLRQTVLELLEELPMRATGLGATEMRMLELISAGNVDPFDVFPGYWKRNQRRVFDYWEAGSLLDGLARCPAPAVSGLDEGPFTDAMHQDRRRFERYKRSKLKLTALGEAIVAQAEDFRRHNPIHRWWGGTELTNDHLWRWDPGNRALVAP